MKLLAILMLLSLTLIAAGCNPVADADLSQAGDVPKIAKESLVDETADGALILYWAEGCSHCDRVKFEIENTGLNKQLNIIAKESYGNDERYREFFERMQYCQVPVHQMGVPMLWDGERCYLGVEEIMDAINNKLQPTSLKLRGSGITNNK